MRQKAWIVGIVFWLLSSVANSDVLLSFAKETPAPEPPACPAKFDDGVVLANNFKEGVTPPKPTTMPLAGFSNRARKELKKNHINNAISVLSMVVGADGVPRDVCLLRAAGYDLDGKAAEAAWKYRFEPAMKDGKTIPARISVEVSFKLY
jgi:TonB family protein